MTDAQKAALTFSDPSWYDATGAFIPGTTVRGSGATECGGETPSAERVLRGRTGRRGPVSALWGDGGAADRAR
jgi:hypothetical protein